MALQSMNSERSQPPPTPAPTPLPPPQTRMCRPATAQPCQNESVTLPKQNKKSHTKTIPIKTSVDVSHACEQPTSFPQLPPPTVLFARTRGQDQTVPSRCTACTQQPESSMSSAIVTQQAASQHQHYHTLWQQPRALRRSASASSKRPLVMAASMQRRVGG